MDRMTINVAVVEAAADTMVLVDGIWVVLKIIFFLLWVGGGLGGMFGLRENYGFLRLDDAGNWGC